MDKRCVIYLKKIANFIVNKRYFIMVLFGIALVLSIIGSFFTTVNYDPAKYLPEDSKTSQGLEIMYDEFGNNGTAQILIKSVTIEKVLKYKEEVKKISGIESVIWLDDILDIIKPEELSTVEFYNLFQFIKSSMPEDLDLNSMTGIVNHISQSKPDNVTSDDYYNMIISITNNVDKSYLKYNIKGLITAIYDLKPSDMSKTIFWAIMLEYMGLISRNDDYGVTDADRLKINYLNLIPIFVNYSEEITFFKNTSKQLVSLKPESYDLVEYYIFLTDFYLKLPTDAGGEAMLFIAESLNDLMLTKPSRLSEAKYLELLLDVFKNLPANLNLSSGIIGQIEGFYKNKNALIQVMFKDTDYSASTKEAIDQIKALSTTSYLGGNAVITNNSISVVNSETIKAMILTVIIVLIILLLMTKSYFEVVVFIITIGVSVIINMGTNFILGDISYMTKGVSSVLQLALTIDYSIFLLHRFNEERKQSPSVKDAMVKAIINTFQPISASSLTTIAGFIAIMFMSYKLGFDMGIVFIKGIVFSLITVIFLMPAIVILCLPLIDKTQHKCINISFNKLVPFLKKYRYIIIVAMAILVYGSVKLSQNNTFIYGNEASLTSENSELRKNLNEIVESFGSQNQLAIVYGNEFSKYELEISKELKEISNVISVSSYALLEADNIDSLLPEEMKSQFMGQNYRRIIVVTDTKEEDEKNDLIFKRISEIFDFYDAEYYLLGNSSSTAEIKNVIEKDYVIISWLSLILVGIIILMVFKSISVPIILLTVIQSSIWINMAIPALFKNPLIFIGYLIVSSIQLGATIDYAILYTNRYIEYRKTNDKMKSIALALNNSYISIVTSALVLGSSGFIISFASTLPAIAGFGSMIGRGALISLVLVLILLPVLLYILDSFVVKTGKKKKTKVETTEV